MTTPANPPPGVKPVLLYVTKGSKVLHLGREYTVLRVVDLNMVLAREKASDEKVLLKIGSLEVPFAPQDREAKAQSDAPDLEAVTTEDWEIAEHKLALLEPLISGRRTKSDYMVAARQAGISKTTLFRWIKDYEKTGSLSSLLPVKKNGGAGKSRLSPDVQLIVDNYIQNQHLTSQKPSVAKTTKEIRRLCDAAGLSPLPAATTIARQISRVSAEESTRKRHGVKAAREQFAVHRGSIPDAEWPLAIVQMDHTLLPVIIVDDVHRKPINRAWITVAIDVFSRMCMGMYLSLDPPSSLSAGMCVSNAILPKEAWLTRLGCGAIDWPCYGAMDVLHMDNAREFRGKMLRVAAKEYHIDLHLRPVKVPHYGAHIERLMGTVTEDLKSVRGATYSGPTERGEYDAEGNAIMTFEEIERWMVLFFVRYHRDMHQGIGTTPLAKWREGILGTSKLPGRGLPARRTDVEKVRIDFMPFEERTIQDYGVVNNRIHYFHDVLRPWMNAMDEKNPKVKRQFRMRYDPRDISQLYFFDPTAGRYFAIPYRDSSLPPVSIWEHRAALKAAKELGVSAYDERAVFKLITRQREIEQSAAAKTKSARREQQRRIQNAKVRTTKQVEMPSVSGPSVAHPAVTAPNMPLRGYDPNAIRPLTDDD